MVARGANPTWIQDIEEAFSLIPRTGLNGAARHLADKTGRPYETCRTALRRFFPGKEPRKLHQPCVRCAQIRALLNRQQT